MLRNFHIHDSANASYPTSYALNSDIETKGLSLKHLISQLQLRGALRRVGEGFRVQGNGHLLNKNHISITPSNRPCIHLFNMPMVAWHLVYYKAMFAS